VYVILPIIALAIVIAIGTAGEGEAAGGIWGEKKT
jgi:hypothetical protein